MQEVDQLAVSKALMVDADVSRWGEPISTMGEKVWVKVSAEDTAGVWSLFESRVPAGLNLPLHAHHYQEEWLWVLEGNFVFEVGGERHRLSKGMSILLPREIPHRWKKCAEGDGRLLILLQPAGRMEQFFETVAKATPEERKDLALARRVFAEAGMELLGPPMEEEVR